MLLQNLFAISLTAIVALGSFSAAAAPDASAPIVFVTWRQDPTSTMVIRWLSTNAVSESVEWRMVGQSEWRSLASESTTNLNPRWLIRGAELMTLSPATDYEFRFVSQTNLFRFRTMPRDLTRPVRFVEGGDVYHERKVLDPVNALAGKFDPAFGVLGGDLAYAHSGNKEDTDRWVDYFDSWMRHTVTPDGRLVPMVVTIGNHEVAGNWGQTPAKAEVFYRLFPLPGRRGYAALDFANYLSLLLLDSGHTTPVVGDQTKWLAENLASRRRVPHVFPIYHITAYPSFRVELTGSSGLITRQIQTNWCPVFDQYDLPLAFEHHDHAFKRTHPMRAGKVDARGTIYLGDGAWAVETRKPKPEKAGAYLAKSAAVRHFYVVTLYEDARHILAVDENGSVFDELYQRVTSQR
jgi:hypothetical protein